MRIWDAMMTGGLAGALFTFCIPGFLRWLKRPILKVWFDDGVEGCLINTPAQEGIEQCYLRLKVQNSGRSETARDVSVCVVKLKHEAKVKGASIFEEEVLDLKLAMTHDKVVFRLAQGAHRYIDLFHTQKDSAGIGSTPDFTNNEIPKRLRRAMQDWGAGTYRFEVFASAENAKSVHCVVSFFWDGQFPGLRIIGNTRGSI